MVEYTDVINTDVAWLPQIPAHWQLQKIDLLFTERKTKVSDKDYAPLSVTKKGILPQLEHAAKSNDSDNRKLVKTGDFVINGRSDRKGSCGVSKLDGSVSLVNLVLTSRSKLNNDYVHYLLRNYRFSEEYYRNGRGIVADLWTTRYSEMRTILLPVPSRAEQDQIVRFLDWKASEINKLIGIRRKEIQGLEEIKSLIINTTVTKGITESCTKSSNVPWIGEIPVDWEIIPLKRCLKNITDVDHYMPPSVAHGIPYIMTGDLKEKVSEINFDNCKRISEQDYKVLSKKSKAQHGDIVFARYATIGTVSYVDEDRDFIVSYSCVILKPDSSMIDGRYLFYYLKSRSFSEDVRQYIKINTQGNVGIDSLKRTVLTRPSIDEQHTIVKYLDTKCKKIDELIRLKQSQVQAYQELKSVIISDAVTGKIDVRNITVPEYEHVDDIADDDAEDSDEKIEEMDEEA